MVKWPAVRTADVPGTRYPMADIRINRKLAAILAADVVGYSRMMGPTRQARWLL